jgi:hypothetical protein
MSWICDLLTVYTPLETILNRDPKIENGLMFGSGRFQGGVLIQPAPGNTFPLGDLEGLAKFRNDIWFVYIFFFGLLIMMCWDLGRHTIELANAFAPSHSRIFKEVT